MASGDLSLTSNSSQEEGPEYVGYVAERTLRPSSNSSGSTAANLTNNSNKKYDNAKYEQAMIELSNLRRQHSDRVRRCEELASQLGIYQEQYVALMEQLNSTANDRSKYAEMVKENASLKQRNLLLDKKLRRITGSAKQQDNDNGNAPGVFFYDEHYSEMDSTKCDGSCLESTKLMEEIQRYEKLYPEISKERNFLSTERDNFRMQLATALNDLKAARHAKNHYQKLVFHQNKELDDMKVLIATKDDQLMMMKMKKSQVSEELNNILSEKDNVLREAQSVSDDLAAYKKNYEQLEMQKKKDEIKYKSEIKSLQQTNNELSRKLDELTLKFEKRELLKSRESSWSKEFSDSKDDFKEIEKLRKSLEKARSEVEKAMEETVLAKSRRDWAISEREKIVQERDSVKTLCDNLRRERDGKTTDLLTAIIDSENIKKQLDEAQKEVESLKEQIENKAIDSRRSIRWSSFDADDVIEIELRNFNHDSDVGIILDDSNNRQLVCGVTNTSPAFGKLKINDVIIKVNSLDCESISKRSVLSEIRASAPRCTLLVCRTRLSKHHLCTVHLNLQDSHSHGLSLDQGFYISKIEQNSLASFQPELDVGDRVLSINNKSMDGVQNVKEAMKILDDHRNDSITIFVLKNIQDISYPEVHRRRVTNTSAQTDSNDSMYKVTSSKHPSKISEILSKFREKIHITKSGCDTDHFTQENDALAALDSVLSENSEKSKENLFKRNKRNKKEKESSKSMGTWPRAAILNTSQENPTGTIVHHRKKERSIALSLFAAGPINVDKEDPPPAKCSSGSSASSSSKNNPNRNSNPIPASLFQQNSSNGFSHRHSVYGTNLETEQSKTLQRSSLVNHMRVKIPDMNSKYATNQRQHHPTHYQNRYSLNLTPSDKLYKTSGQTAQQQVSHQQQMNTHQQYLDFISKNKPQSNETMLNMKIPSFGQHPGYSNSSNNQQNSLDMISIKSQNSIDSFLSQKSPPIQDYYYSKRPGQTRSVLKYPSDSESIGMDSLPSGGGGSNTTSLPPTTFFPQPNRHTPLFPQFVSHGHSFHPHPHKTRQQSPLTLPSSPHSIEHSTVSQNIGVPVISSTDKFDVDYATPSHPSSHHAYNISMDYSYNRGRTNAQRDNDDAPSSYPHVYEGGTFPRKKENQRFRIPSNPSVTSKGSGVKNSTGSIDHHGSERGSPMPPVHVEILSHGANKRNSNVPDFLCPGDLRRVTIDKSDKPLGITIQCNNNGGGIFVSTVAEKSIASRAGLQVGDQLLEVCGINMRSATNDIAANVLRQCGNSITMLVQYNPEKYDGGNNNLESEAVNHSGSPTPRNSPRPPARLTIPSPPSSSVLKSNTPLPQSTSLISTPIKNQKFADSLENQSDSSHRDSSGSVYEDETRFINIQTEKCKNLGVKLCGGNKVGIFVNEVKRDSPADIAGIRVGDQILEYNGINMRSITAEQAANMLSKLPDEVTMLVQNQLQKLSDIQDKTGDSFYIRVGFDRIGDMQKDDLRFVKDEVLYVDSTICNGEFGQWRAWKLNEKGHRTVVGVIPSQSKVEEELRLAGDNVDCDGNTTRRGSTSARRSFFRRKKHQRSSSRDSKELASFSNTQLSYFSDSGMLNDDGGLLSYQRVERLDYPVCRPVLVIGPLSEIVSSRLTVDFSSLFAECVPTIMECSNDAVEEGLQNNIFVDYRRKGNVYECTLVDTIRNVVKNNKHCVLDVSMSAVERLQRLQIYPIVLLLRFKSAKQIKEIKDSCGTTDKNSAKAAKEMYERALKLESDYKQYISAVIPAGGNITHMSTQIKASVDEEQSRILWVPFSNS